MKRLLRITVLLVACSLAWGSALPAWAVPASAQVNGTIRILLRACPDMERALSRLTVGRGGSAFATRDQGSRIRVETPNGAGEVATLVPECARARQTPARHRSA